MKNLDTFTLYLYKISICYVYEKLEKREIERDTNK